jgi:hypothetical protein
VQAFEVGHAQVAAPPSSTHVVPGSPQEVVDASYQQPSGVVVSCAQATTCPVSVQWLGVVGPQRVGVQTHEAPTPAGAHCW